jgi:hypothetical protein
VVGAPAHHDVTDIDLLAYNKMGEAKYERLGKTSERREVQDERHVQVLRDVVKHVLA